MALQAIETEYHGYRFRSREEARWAVFFDQLAIPFEYEKEGYHVGGFWYLPDFWLPQQQAWFEVKGQFPDDAEWQKATALARASEHDVWIACARGSVGELEAPGFRFQYRDVLSPRGFLLRFGTDGAVGIGNWYQCGFCGRFWPRRVASLNFVECPEDICCIGARAHPMSAALRSAYLASRQARFERIEAGIPS